MWPSSALCMAMALALSACGSEIVLGDSEAPLPVTTAGANTSAGAPTSGMGGMPISSGGGGSGDTASGSGGVPQMPDTTVQPPGELVWSTDHEVGDFSDWKRGGDFNGGQYEWGKTNSYVDIGVGRNGSNGVVADIVIPTPGETSSGARMYRRIEPGPAYYSAWFRLEDAHRVLDWWSIFLFHAREDSLSMDTDVSMWDVRIVNTPDGEMTLQFFDHDTMQGTVVAGQGLIANRRWFEISAYLDYRPPDATRLQISLNGSVLFDMKNLHTAVPKNVFWAIGNGAGSLDPVDSTIDLDDAAIHKAAAP